MEYIGGENAEHLMTSIKKKSDISSDYTGIAYCGLKIDWDYTNGTVDLSMHGYIKAASHKYQNSAPTRAEHAPHKWNPPVYGSKTQYM
jgi:endonuclease I